MAEILNQPENLNQAEKLDQPKTRDPEAPEKSPGMGRRNVLRGLLTGAGAGLALPGLAETHPLAEHAHHTSRMAVARTKALDSPGAPEFLDAYQFAMFETLSEHIVPGAMVAGCARFVDSLLAVGERDDRQRFLSALGAIDALARERFSSPWPELSGEQRDQLLGEVSEAGPGREEKYWTPGTPAAEHLVSRGSVAPLTIRDQFDVLKGWVVGSYYSSELGQRELGYKGPAFAEEFPGCQHPGGHR